MEYAPETFVVDSVFLANTIKDKNHNIKGYTSKKLNEINKVNSHKKLLLIILI